MSFPDWLAAVVKYLSELQYFIAGLMGAAVATRYNKEQLKTPKDYAVFLLSGAFTAHYLTLPNLGNLVLEAAHWETFRRMDFFQSLIVLRYGAWTSLLKF